MELWHSLQVSANRSFVTAANAAAEGGRETVQPLPQRYTRLAERTYLYESLRDGVVVFHARLEVDGTGLVERYEGLFERIA